MPFKICKVERKKKHNCNTLDTFLCLSRITLFKLAGSAHTKKNGDPKKPSVGIF